VIVAIDGRPVLRTEDVNVAILDGEVGQSMKVTIERAGQTKDIKLTLTKRPRSRGDRR
jgi:S1-C subfamily serine protease